MQLFLFFFLYRPRRIVVREVALSLPGIYKKVRAPKNYDMIMIEQSVDWLHNRLFILILKMKLDGQKEYRVVSCDTGKWISELKYSVIPRMCNQSWNLYVRDYFKTNRSITLPISTLMKGK